MKYTGLNEQEVIESREKNGENVLVAAKKETLFQKILKTAKEPMFFLLIAASLIYFLLGEYIDGATMLIFVIGICSVEIVQEAKTDRAIEELNNLTSVNISVIRNGEQVTIKSSDVVVNDILLLHEGDKVPADGVVLEANGLGVDESLLTGESTLVYKGKGNKCYSGTSISVGNVYLKVTSVGKNTEYGKIGESLNNIKVERTPLEKQTDKIVKISFILCIICFLLVIIINIFTNASGDVSLKETIIHAILSGITVAMATIPEEIPVIMTVFLALGAYSLSKKKVLTRSIKAVETLGAVSVLCVDKTGTLTQNKMIVKDTYKIDDNFDKILTLACLKEPNDPMEKAILNYAYDNNIKESIFNKKNKYEYLFNNQIKMMGRLWETKDGNLLCVKGATERVLPLCKNCDREAIILKETEFANLGYRVLALAKKENVTDIKKKIDDYDLTFCGLIAFVDPPKEKVMSSVQTCYDAGIRIIMITGDSGDTAKGIADQIKIKHDGIVITGEELEKMTDLELQEKVKFCNIFARVYPNHKMRIVDALQRNREIVAMTGDGINDAPALKKAEIGIAMGKRGTNVAKEAADMILTDDNFSTIVDAIYNGRSIYNNIKRAICYIIAIHIPIALSAILIPLFDLPALLLPIHVVLLELIIDPTSTIVFQRIKPDKNLMNTIPRRIDEPIINKQVLIRSFMQGITITAVFFISYLLLIKNNCGYEFSVTFSFIILVMSNLFLASVIQSDKPGFTNLMANFKDKVILFIHGAIIIAMIVFTYTPLNKLTNMTNINIKYFFLAILLSFISTYIFDIFKIIRMKKQKNH